MLAPNRVSDKSVLRTLANHLAQIKWEFLWRDTERKRQRARERERQGRKRGDS